MITKKEVWHFFICVLVLTFIFGFEDGSLEFEFLGWLNNFIMIFILAFICLLIYVLSQKFAAYRYDAFTEFKIWSVSRFKVVHKWINPKKVALVPIGILVGILITLLSYGKIIFTALWENTVGFDRKKRVGWDPVFVTEYQAAKILFAGPAILIIFMIFLAWLGKFGYDVDVLSNMAFLIAFINMIPIPGLDGSKIFFSSRPLWVFSFLFVILAFVLRYTGIITSIILSIALAWILMAIYYYRWKV